MLILLHEHNTNIMKHFIKFFAFIKSNLVLPLGLEPRLRLLESPVLPYTTEDGTFEQSSS